ncbi:MAG: hypothetical protein HFG57_03795 [Lachnospiraceae bacterium]|nr:hypothetical protein [Lachnospiraceae bacterium]
MFLLFILVIVIIGAFLIGQSEEKDNNSELMDGYSKRKRDNYYRKYGRNVNLTHYYTYASQKGCKDSFCSHERDLGNEFYCDYYKMKVTVKDVCPEFEENLVAGFNAANLECEMMGEETELHFTEPEWFEKRGGEK